MPSQTNFEFQEDNKSVVISLNSSMLNGTAQEYMAGVIIHEMVYAYLYSKSVNTSLPDTIIHGTIATQYIDKISTALQSLFLNLTSREANALAIGGITDISNINIIKQQYGFNIGNDLKNIHQRKENEKQSK